MKVRNITGDTLGYNGLVFQPGQVHDVPAGQAETMATSNPGKFHLVSEPAEASPPKAAAPSPKPVTRRR